MNRQVTAGGEDKAVTDDGGGSLGHEQSLGLQLCQLRELLVKNSMGLWLLCQCSLTAFGSFYGSLTQIE